MSQIKIQDLLPLLRKGWVAFDRYGILWLFRVQPILYQSDWVGDGMEINLSDMLNIAPYDGDWKDSLMECGK